MKRYHRRRMTRWGVTACSPTMVMLHDTRFVECRWWNDGWTVKTVVTGRSSASMIPLMYGSLSYMWFSMFYWHKRNMWFHKFSLTEPNPNVTLFTGYLALSARLCFSVACLFYVQSASNEDPRDGSVDSIWRAATLRWKLQIKLAVWPRYITLTPG